MVRNMLNLDQILLLDRFDDYIDYCESQGYKKPDYSTYFVSVKEQRLIDEISRANVVYKLSLPLLGNKYRCLNLICSKNIYKDYIDLNINDLNNYSGVSHDK